MIAAVLTVLAKVVTKRSDVNYHHHNNNMTNNMPNNTMDMGYSSTDYYVTFEVPSGDRMEFHFDCGCGIRNGNRRRSRQPDVSGNALSLV